MTLLILTLVGAVLAVVVLGVASGRIHVDPLAHATHSTPDHGLPPVPDAADVDAAPGQLVDVPLRKVVADDRDDRDLAGEE